MKKQYCKALFTNIDKTGPYGESYFPTATFLLHRPQKPVKQPLFLLLYVYTYIYTLEASSTSEGSHIYNLRNAEQAVVLPARQDGFTHCQLLHTKHSSDLICLFMPICN